MPDKRKAVFDEAAEIGKKMRKNETTSEQIFIDEIKKYEPKLAEFYELNPQLINVNNDMTSSQEQMIRQQARACVQGYRSVKDDQDACQNIHNTLNKFSKKLLKTTDQDREKLVNEIRAHSKDKDFDLRQTVEKHTGFDYKDPMKSVQKILGKFTGGDKDKSKISTESDQINEILDFTGPGMIIGAIKGMVIGSIISCAITATPISLIPIPFTGETIGSLFGGAVSGAMLVPTIAVMIAPPLICYNVLKFSPIDLPIIGSHFDKGDIAGTLSNLLQDTKDSNYTKPIVLSAQDHIGSEKNNPPPRTRA